MNDFYSIGVKHQELTNPFQLENLGDQTIYAIIGKSRRSDFWGDGGHSQSKTIYTSVTSETYDNAFTNKLATIKPPYDMPLLLEFHLGHYINVKGGNKVKFVQHMRFVILPKLRRYRNKDEYLELLNEWIEDNDINLKNKRQVGMSKLQIGKINGPTQIQLNSNNSSQTQNITYTKKDIQEFMSLLKADIEKLPLEKQGEFETEIEYALKQIEKDKDISPQLKSIGSLIANVGLSMFTNLISSGIFEIIKPALGM